jgi:hypothetical protein
VVLDRHSRRVRPARWLASGRPAWPNPRLQRTRSALLRSPLSRKPLDDTCRGECGVETSPSREPRGIALGRTRNIRAATTGRVRLVEFGLSSNPRLHRTRAAVLLQSVACELAASGSAGRAPLSRKPLGNA